MPRQNRVTPLGEIIATPARGTLMGNRGCLHNEAGHLRRQYQGTRWIHCVLEFKGRKRALMQPGRYTELFFLDEATALAAGHRPCAECQRERFLEFRQRWAEANPALAGSDAPPVGTLDGALHRERLPAWPARALPTEALAALPDGTFILLPDNPAPHLVLGDALLPWQPAGYDPPLPCPASALVQVITPPSIVRTLAAGYVPALHPSAKAEDKTFNL